MRKRNVVWLSCILMLSGTMPVLAAGSETARPEAAGLETARPEAAGSETARPETASSETVQEGDIRIFETLPEEFVFSSGAGGWSTILDLEEDGTFTGTYTDSEMGDAGSGYENGTVYICEFHGKFTAPIQIEDTIYQMELDSLESEGTVGEVYYENNIRYIYADPCGFDDAEMFLLYLPGTPISDVEEEFMTWARDLAQSENKVFPDDFYGIYNVEGEEGFVGYSELE